MIRHEQLKLGNALKIQTIIVCSVLVNIESLLLLNENKNQILRTDDAKVQKNHFQYLFFPYS